eukprot:Hpha_TRINITY_DN10205_c0_g1::TRINITY_DN10205_c0_g1_i1::g.34911::m.34911
MFSFLLLTCTLYVMAMKVGMQYDASRRRRFLGTLAHFVIAGLPLFILDVRLAWVAGAEEVLQVATLVVSTICVALSAIRLWLVVAIEVITSAESPRPHRPYPPPPRDDHIPPPLPAADWRSPAELPPARVAPPSPLPTELLKCQCNPTYLQHSQFHPSLPPPVPAAPIVGSCGGVVPAPMVKAPMVAPMVAPVVMSPVPHPSGALPASDSWINNQPSYRTSQHPRVTSASVEAAVWAT